MANISEIESACGWMVRASMLDGSVRTFYVYEPDGNKAADLAKTAIAATIGETVETVKLLSIHELATHGVKPGDVKQYV
jgi:hypothetical protein